MAFIKHGDAEVVAVVGKKGRTLVKCKKCQQMVPKGEPCPHCIEDEQGEEN